MSGLVQPMPVSAVPEDIVQILRRLIRRSRAVLFVRGCCAVAAVGLAALLAAMAVDAGLTFFSRWPRWALSFSALGVTLLAALWFLVRPLRRSFTLAGVAMAIEAHHPELQERLSSAVELLASQDAPELRGSEALLSALAAEACRDAKAVRPRREVTLRAVRPYLLAAAALAAVLASVFLLWPGEARHVWTRIVAPYRDLPNVLGSQLHIDPNHDSVIAAGEELDIEVAVDHRAVTGAEIRRPAAHGEEAVTPMTPLPPREGGLPRFALTFPPATESFQYRIRAGDALSRTYTVTVVPRPAVERFHIAYEFPAYTRRPREDRPEGEAEIHAVTGTTVEVRAVTNTPIDSAELRVNGQVVARGEVNSGDGRSACTFRFPLTPKLRGNWCMTVSRTVGGREFAAATDLKPIEAVADAAPLAKIISPSAASLRLKPTDRLPIIFAAGDDFGLARADLLLEVDGQSRPPLPVTLLGDANGPLRIAEGRSVLDLAEVAGHGAGAVVVRARVQDGLPESLGGPQEGVSPALTIHVDSQAVSYVRQVVLAEELAIRDVLLAVLAELKESKKDSAPLRKEVDAQADANRPTAETTLSTTNAQRAGRICQHLGAADAAIRDVLPRLADGEFVDMAQKLATLSNDHISRANDLCGQIRLADKAAQRGELADEADFQIDRAIAMVNDMLKELQVLSELAQRAEEVADLSKRQDELASQLQDMKQPANPQTGEPTSAPSSQPASAPSSLPASMPAGSKTPPAQASPQDMQQWKQEQQAVAGRLAEMVRQSTKAMQQTLGQQEQAAKNLSAEARKLAAEQSAVAEMTKKAGEVSQLQKELRELAAKQAALAEQAARPAPRQATTMSAAAESLKTDQIEKALGQQLSAEKGLAGDANAINRELVTSEMARKAERIANRQESIAAQSADLKAAAENAAAQAKTATTQAAKTSAEQQAAEKKLASDLAALRDRQQALAQRSAKIEAASASPLTGDPSGSQPASAPAPAAKPSEAMSAAAKELAPEKLASAASAVKEALRQADAQAAKLADSAKAADPNAAEAQSQAAKAAAEKAAAAAKSVSDAASAARQVAQAAAEKALAAEKKASDAKTAAAQSAATSQPDATAKTAAAEEARQSAATARTHAQAMNDAADRAAKAAADAAKQASDAQKRSGELDASKADRAKADADAAKKAGEARAIAHEQKKIDSDLAQLAPAAKDAQEAAARAKAAQSEQAKHEKSAADAAEKLAQLAKPQEELRQQAEELAKSAESATPEAKQALAKSDPRSEMQQAAQSMQSKAAPQAAQKAGDAARKARQLARDLRQADAASTPLARSGAKEIEAAEKLERPRDANEQVKRLQEAAALTDEAARLDGNASPPQAAARQSAANAAQALRDAAKAQQEADAAEAAAEKAQAKAKEAAGDPSVQQAAKQAARQANQQAQSAAQAASAARRKASSALDAAQTQAEKAAAADNKQREAAAEKLAQLARAQNDLRKQTAEKAAQAAQAAEALRSQQWAALGKQQAQVAGDAAAMADRVKAAAPQDDRLDTKAARSAAESADQFAAAKDANARTRAARSSEKSAQELAELSRRVAQRAAEPSADANSEKLASDANRLASRQETIARQAAALAEGRLLDAVRPPQEQLAGRTNELADDVGLVRTFADQIIPDKAARQDANQALSAVEQALAAQNKAQEALAARSAAPAEAQQRKAAAALEAAAGALDQLGRKMNDLAKANPADAPDEESSQMADSLDAANQAARSEKPRDAALAAEMLKQLAKTTQAHAEAVGVAMQPSEDSPQDPQGQPSQNSRGLRGTGLVPTEMLTGELRPGAFRVIEWGKLSGELKNEILQGAADEGPEEYRGLIKRYFEEVARRGAEQKKEAHK